MFQVWTYYLTTRIDNVLSFYVLQGPQGPPGSVGSVGGVGEKVMNLMIYNWNINVKECLAILDNTLRASNISIKHFMWNIQQIYSSNDKKLS